MADTDDAIKAAVKRASEQLAWHRAVADKMSKDKPTNTDDALRQEMAETLAILDGWENPNALWTDNIGLARSGKGQPVYMDYLEEADALLAGPVGKHIAALKARIATLESDLSQARDMLKDYAAERAPEAMEILAKDRDHWRKLATAGEARIAELEAENTRLSKMLREIADDTWRLPDDD